MQIINWGRALVFAGFACFCTAQFAKTTLYLLLLSLLDRYSTSYCCCYMSSSLLLLLFLMLFFAVFWSESRVQIPRNLHSPSLLLHTQSNGTPKHFLLLLDPTQWGSVVFFILTFVLFRLVLAIPKDRCMPKNESGKKSTFNKAALSYVFIYCNQTVWFVKERQQFSTTS